MRPITTVCVLILLVAATHGGPVNRDDETRGCYWLCGNSGDFISCEANEMVAGECGSGGLTSNCKDATGCSGLLGNIHAIRCCQLIAMA